MGAGASGLWLANALLEHGLLETNTLRIVESDVNKDNDRTWCYWATDPIAPVDMVSKVWKNIHQSNLAKSPQALYPNHYFHVRSSDFYSTIKETLKSCANIFWVHEPVIEITELTNHVGVKTTNAHWQSDKIFLSASPDKEISATHAKFLGTRHQKDSIFLWQSFVGWRVETTSKTFVADNMSMMDFNVDQAGFTQFMYELPFSETEALIELTRFGEEKLSQQQAEQQLRDYMRQKNSDYKIVETEIGAIPMTTKFDIVRKKIPLTERVIYIGTLAGSLKPTSGFGFKRMHRYSNQLANALKIKQDLPTMSRPWRFRLYDILLLQILKDKPTRGKEIFERLFRHQPINRILKFLDEETNVVEELKIFIRLPIQLFLGSLFTFLRRL